MNQTDVIDALAQIGLESSLYALADKLKVRYNAAELSKLLDTIPGLTRRSYQLSWDPAALHRATLDLFRRKPAALTASRYDWMNRQRFAVYRGDLDVVLEPHSLAQFFWPIDEPFLLSRPPAMRARLFEGLAAHLWMTGGWTQPLQQAVLQCPVGSSSPAGLELKLARGQALGPLPQPLKKQGYLAAELFLQGDAAGALTIFRKLYANRKAGFAVFSPFVALFGRLAAFSVGDIQAFMDPRLGLPSWPWLNRCLDELGASAQKQTRLILQGSYSELKGLPACVLWAMRSQLESPLVALPEIEQQFRTQGLLVFAEQMLERPARPWLPTALREPWQLWLESLRQSDPEQPKPKAASANKSTEYLAFSLFYPEVVPYKLKTGGAFPGKHVRLTTLLSKPPDFLTEQDRVFLGKIRLNVYNDPVFTAEAWQALVGHPHLYYEKEPCELVAGETRLSLKKAEGGLTLALSPSYPPGKNFVVKKQKDGVLALYTRPAWAQTLLPLLEKPQVVPPEGEGELRELLSGWLGRIRFSYDKGVAPLGIRAATTTCLSARLVPESAGLRLSWVVGVQDAPGLALPALRGQTEESVRWQGKVYEVRRDFAREIEALQALQERCPALDGAPEQLFLTRDEALDALAQLKAVDVPLEWPGGRAWRLRPPVCGPQIRVQALADGEWFALQGGLAVDEQQILELGKTLELLRLYPGRYVPVGENDFVLLQDRVREQLLALDELSEEHRHKLRISPLAVPTLAELQVEGLTTDQAFDDTVARFEEANRMRPYLPRGLQAELRDYQVDGYRWLAQRARAGAGACLADDMGLGKTLQALALMLKERKEGPHLVVCPTSVTANWRDQMLQYAPTLEPVLYEGKGRCANVQAGQVLIVSYRVLLQDLETLRAVDWHVVLLDEAQAIKNPESKTARACFALRGRVRVATTGTPIENRLTELWSIFRFLNPGLLGTLASFRRRFEAPILAGEQSTHRRLRRLVAPFLLRRLKSQVLQELPPRTELSLSVELTSEERAIYENLRRQAEQETNPVTLLGYLARLRQACCHPRLVMDQSDLKSSKFAAFFELLEDLVAGRHRALVFSQFTSLLDLLQAELVERQVEFLRLDGTTPAPERRRLVDDFQNGTGDVFLISLKAGGTGLNLTGADYVVHLDPWWNPAAEDQASDRAHRIGQSRPVTIYRLIAKDTIEEKVLGLHGMKRDLAQGMLEGRERSAGLNARELRELVEV